MRVARDCLTDEKVYANFKRNPYYTKILEHCAPHFAEQMLDKLLTEMANDHYFRIQPDGTWLCDGNLHDFFWDHVRDNDVIGNPKKHNFQPIFAKHGFTFWSPEEYEFSPTTIAYAYQAYHIFTKNRREGLRIVEIGGGYGGLCYILQSFYWICDLPIESYTIIDLPDISKHQNKYLSEMDEDLKFQTIPYTEVDSSQSYDLCISIYALGEFSRPIIDSYYRDVLSKSEHIYLWWNLSPIPEYLSSLSSEKTGFNIPGHDLIMWK